MSAIRKLASETAIYGIPTIIGRLVNFLLVPLYTGLFSPSEYGVVNNLYAYAGFFSVLLTYGMETTLFRFANEDPENDKVYGTAYNSVIITTLFFLFVSIVFKQPIAEWMEVEEYPQYFIWFAVLTGFDALVAIPFVKLRQHGKAKKFALIRSINIFTNIGLNLFFLKACPYLLNELGWDWISYIYNPSIGIGYIFIANLVASLITWPLVYPENIQFNYGFDPQLWRRMIVYAMPLLLVGLAGMVNELLDRILLAKLLPEDSADRELGIYSACYKLSLLISIFIQAYRMAAEPFLFARAKGEGAQATYAKLMDYFVIVCGFIFLFVSFNLQFFADLFLRDKEYHEGLEVVPILLLANLFLGMYYNFTIWYKLTDKTGRGSLISVSAAVITIALNLITIPFLSYLGSAITTLAAYFYMAVACYLLGKKYYPIPYNLNKIYAYILLMAVLFFIQLIIKNTTGGENWLVGLLLMSVYGLLV
ncbi:MAG TPA: oligosaccharide flippase family protein, partial [Bacteroidia bacterium]|nr:oligosaccharide flippase family protein [Bacteroidia bacterium]